MISVKKDFYVLQRYIYHLGLVCDNTLVMKIPVLSQVISVGSSEFFSKTETGTIEEANKYKQELGEEVKEVSFRTCLQSWSNQVRNLGTKLSTELFLNCLQPPFP